ncbi:MAG: hypothetical protein J6Z42_01390 [Lachnospiraceae bacterium]|nr:hypothetical protein [Lachnospiraceae bacterium]
MKTGKFVSVVLSAVLIAAAACGCQKSETLESWAYSYESETEALKLCNNGTAVFDGNDYTYTKDNEYIDLKDKNGQEIKMRYTVSGDEMTLYKISSYTLQGDGGAEGIVGVWNCGNSAFEFTDKGTFLEDNIFPGHYLVDKDAGTIKLMYTTQLEDTVMYFTLDGNVLTIEYPWPMVKTGSGSKSVSGQTVG